MLQKPPVIFTQYAPSRVISSTELATSRRISTSRNGAISWLWASYGCSILAEVDPCMEANEGAAATLAFTSRYKSLSRMAVTRTHRDSYELKLGDASLYLTETEAGDVFLYFFSPDKYYYRREEYRIDLTDFGSDAAAYFIATMFGSYESLVDYYELGYRHDI